MTSGYYEDETSEKFEGPVVSLGPAAFLEAPEGADRLEIRFLRADGVFFGIGAIDLDKLRAEICRSDQPFWSPEMVFKLVFTGPKGLSEGKWPISEDLQDTP